MAPSLNALTYGNSKTLSATYDQDYRPTNRTVSGVFNDTYATDDEGNITQKGSWTFEYDELNRLDEQDDSSTTTAFTYDAIGNRLTENDGSSTSYTYPSTSSKLSSVGSDSYTYDAMGNITGDGARTYVWSAAGLLKEAKIGGSTVVAYTYDAANLRTKKVAGGNTIHYVYGLGGFLYGEYDNSGNLIREYVWLNGEPLAQIDAGSPEVLTYLHTDHLATPRAGSNAAGSTVWTWDSGAFGKEVATGSATVNLRFPGQYFDSETGLHYNWNRYYNPATGRYVSSDPIGLAGGLNTYTYVSASPVMFVDPRGQDCVKNNGVVTCSFPGGGPQVSFPAPDGWPDKISSNDIFYHSYEIHVPLKGASASCVMQGIINSPTPGNDAPASYTGTSNNALPTWLSSTGIPAPVKSYVSDDGTAVLNVTEPGHPLFPGYVLRIYEAVGGPEIVNYGEGAGFPQSGVMPPPIPYFINGVWYGETNDVICSCK